MSIRSGAFLRPMCHAAAAVAFCFGSALAQVPNPVVTAVSSSVPAGDPSHDYIFFATNHLAGTGYVEQEFFIEARPIAT